MPSDVLFANRPTRHLVALAHRALGMTHREFGEVLGASERTSQRWARTGAALSVGQLRKLAVLVHPVQPDLGRQIAEACSETLVSLGIVAPPPPSPVPPPAPLAAHLAADLVVCAAADAIGAAPAVARTALAAAFARMAELGLTAADIARAFAPRTPSP